MDSSDLQTTNSTETMPSDIVDNTAMIIPSKRDIFLSTYNRRQRFTLPDSMMHYIAKNPKNTKVYQKMIKRCKYFFVKNPILVLSNLHYNQNGWRTWIDINRILCKLWITDKLDVSPENVSSTSIASSIIPKIYQCDAKRLTLYNQIIFLNEFMFLCSSVEELDLKRVTVKNYDGTEVSFEKLIEQIPKLKRIYYTFTTPSNNTTKNTFKELWKIPDFSNYDCFNLYNIPEGFDIEIFYSSMKKNKHASVRLYFFDQISEEYKTRLEAIVDKIIGAKNHEYKVPYIEFPGLDQEPKLFNF